MGLLHRIMPTRDEYKPTKVIADLDSIVSQRISVTLLGRDHIIDPITTENYIKVCQALHDIEVIGAIKQDDPDFDKDAIYFAYHRFAASVCRTITIEDIRKAALAQLHGLMAVIIKHIKGETLQDMVVEKTEETEKKKLKSPLLNSSLLSRFFAIFTRLVSKT